MLHKDATVVEVGLWENRWALVFKGWLDFVKGGKASHGVEVFIVSHKVGKKENLL